MSELLAVYAWIQMLPSDPARYSAKSMHVFKQYGVDVSRPMTPERIVAEMDVAGVQIAILSAVVFGELTVSNDEVAAAVRRYPDRFIGQACVDPREVMPAVRELERAVTELGLRAGLKVEPFLWERVPTDPIFYPLYAKCAELGVPVTIQVGNSGALFPSETGLPCWIDQIALDFPELTIIGGHMGWPWLDEMMALASKHANVYIDTSAHRPKNFLPQFLDFIRTWGQEKVLWGTGWPVLPFDRQRAEALALNLPEAATRKFLRENALRVFAGGRSLD